MYRTQSRRTFLASMACAPSLSFLGGCVNAPSRPQVNVGRLERLTIASRFVESRPIDVWLPPDFKADGSHAVLYMHDGQMLFDASTTWNKKAWNAHLIAERLIRASAVRPFIIVGIWNIPEKRRAEYFPNAMWPRLREGAARQYLVNNGLAEGPSADAYLRHLVEEIRPEIESRFRVSRRRDDRLIAGSSRGGVVSLYGLCEYSELFAGAACMSTHWIGSFDKNAEATDAALSYLAERLPLPEKVRLYMDRGTVGLDAKYDEAQTAVDALLKAKGFQPPRFDSRVFQGAEHDEVSWSARFDIALKHLLT